MHLPVIQGTASTSEFLKVDGILAHAGRHLALEHIVYVLEIFQLQTVFALEDLLAVRLRDVLCQSLPTEVGTIALSNCSLTFNQVEPSATLRKDSRCRDDLRVSDSIT